MFLKGKTNLTVCRLAQKTNRYNLLELIADKPLADPTTIIGDGQHAGFSGGKGLLQAPDENNTEAGAGILHFHLVRAKKKIPANWLKEQCHRAEEIARKQRDTAVLSRKARQEIKEEIQGMLLEDALPDVNGIELILCQDEETLLIGSTGNSDLEFVQMFLEEVTGVALYLPDIQADACEALGRTSITDLILQVGEAEQSSAVDPGQDFLTWMWYATDAHEGILKWQDKELAFAMEGPLTLRCEDDNESVIGIKAGMPTITQEAGISLLKGKKLVKAKLTLALDGETLWKFTSDNEMLSFRGLKLPATESINPTEILLDNVSSMLAVHNIWSDLFRLYLNQVLNHKDLLERDILKWARKLAEN